MEQAQREVDEVALVMSKNILKVQEREEKLENLESRAEKLELESQIFQKNAAKLKRKSLLENYKYKIAAGGAVGLVILIIVLICVL